MAYLAASAIQKRVREVIEGAAGSLRTITAGTYAGDMPEGNSDMDLARGAIAKPTVEALVTSAGRSASSPPVIGNLALYDLELRVRVVRIIDRTMQINDTLRDAAKALAFQDADVLAQALGFPGNLSTTAAATATGIVSGLFTYRGSQSSVRGPVDDVASIIETDHRFTAIARSTPAVS